MGNTNSASHVRAASRHDAVRVDRRRSVRGNRREVRTSSSAITPSHRKQHTHCCALSKSPTTPSPSLPGHTVEASCRPSPLLVPSSTSGDGAPQPNASNLLGGAQMQRIESGTSNDSLAESIRVADEVSEMTLGTSSSCPLVGPRNITTQFDQDSEKLKFGSCIFKTEVVQSDATLDKQSSTAAELMRQESFEGRMSHSIAIVEDWFASLEKGNPLVG